MLPEETLVSQVQLGELDVGFFYSTETTGAKLPSVVRLDDKGRLYSDCSA